MKNRWIGGLVLALAVALGACAPPGQGGGASDEPTSAPSVAAPPASEAAEPSEPAEPSETASTPAPQPSYDYDY